jgi:ATP-dependent helicase/nuclease subunit A
LSKFLLYRASAGSGKTFMLVRQFLRQAFESPFEYRKILAVTFTNKAADEMKERILDELDLLSTRPERSKHRDFLLEYFAKPQDWIRETAGMLKQRMLHDYSRISVGTIDSFFQQVLRAFARESGIPLAYQVEPDNTLVLEQFPEYIFDEAISNPDLMSWLVEWVTERTENQEGWKTIDAELVRLGAELLKEEILADFVEGRTPAPEPAAISRLKDFCRRTLHDFKRHRQKIADEAAAVLREHGLAPADFTYGMTGPVGFLLKLADKADDPAKRAVDSLNDPDKWVKKSDPADKRNRIIQGAWPKLNRLMDNALTHYQSQNKLYRSCAAVNRNLFALGFSSFLFRFLDQKFQENNTLLLSLTQPLINTIIGENPSPFIYEKTGTFYSHFLIDEFQDTSDLQWSNFRPLITDSLASDGLSMIVGDIKQSLYRWRNSNWRLLHERVADDLRAFGSERISLDTNQRSRKAIIDFNNNVFSRLPSMVSEALFAADGPDPGQAVEIGRIYGDSRQEDGNKAGKAGRVEIRFIDRKDKTAPWKEKIQEELPRMIEDLLLNRGYHQDDITFLVRRNSDGDEIIRMLTRSEAYERASASNPWTFVSSDVFRIGNSPVVDMIINALRFLADRNQEGYRDMFLLRNRLRLVPQTLPEPGFHLADREDFDAWAASVAHLDLLMVVDQLVSVYGLDGAVDDLPYLFQFRDQVKSCISRGINHPGSFIDWWEATGKRQMLASENTGSSMRIMTIHKAKGLSSPVVIIPYCNWDFNHPTQRAPWLWVPTADTPFDAVERLPVRYEGILDSTWFSASYRRERMDACLDSINLLYVAFTRAVDVLIAFCPYEKPIKSVADALYQTLSQDLTEEGAFQAGDPEFCRITEPVSAVPSVSYPVPMVRGGLKASISHRIQPETDVTRFGRKVHQVLESVVKADDLEKSVERSVAAGDFTPDEAVRIGERVRHLLSLPEVEDWFSGRWEVLNEAAILVPSVGQKRPDRIMIRDGRVVVVDYKTGSEEPDHQRQVRTYMQLVAGMGFNAVEGYLLYLDPGKVVAVTDPEGSSRPGPGHQATLPGFQPIP